MAPLPANGTPRFYIDYTSLGVEHTLMLRPAIELDATAMLDMWNAWTTLLTGRMLETDSCYQCRYSEQGADFSLPQTMPVYPGTLGAGTPRWEQDPESTQLSFIGRSTTTGRKVRYFFFTPIRTTLWPADNRYNPGEEPVIDALRTNWSNQAVFGGDGAPPTVALDGTFITIYGYVNIASNAYWQREQRG